MGSSYSRTTRNTASTRSKVASSSETDHDNNVASASLHSDKHFTHERKDSKKFWISHVRFKRQSSGDLRRSSSQQKPEIGSNPTSTSTSDKQTTHNAQAVLSKTSSFDSSIKYDSHEIMHSDKDNEEGCKSTQVPRGLGIEEKEELVGNSGVAKQSVNFKDRYLSHVQLYNILNDGALSPCICDPTYILLLDTRSKQEYATSHIRMARHSSCLSAEVQTDNIYGYQSNINTSEFTWVISYGDELTDDHVKLMQQLDNSDDTELFILSSGFKSFQEEYPFLCSREENIDFKKPLQMYPSIIVDKQLYQGRGDQATSLQVINDLQITHIINITQEHASAFPEKVQYLTLKLDDVAHTELIKHFDKTTEFLISAVSSGGRVLVHCNLGVSRSSTISIAYLMQVNKWKLQEAYDFLKDKRTCIRPNRGFLKQLAIWEERKLGKKYTDPDDLWF